MSRDQVALFPDTNALLHYPPLADVDWLTVCDAKKVTIVFCMQVIHELDEKKSDPQLGSRAERAIREIKRIKESGNVVRENVLLDIFNQELRADEFTDSLSPDSGDDRIVHLVKKFIQTTGQKDVAIYSEDLGMNLRCEAYGISGIEPDKSARLENPQSELDKKYKAAITELNALKNQAPVIAIRVTDSDGEPNVETPFTVELTSRIELIDPDETAETEGQELLRKMELEPEPMNDDASTLASAVNEYIGYTKLERQRYEREVKEYLAKCRQYIDETNSFKDIAARFLFFKIHIINSGRCPADDLNAVLAFPPGFQFLATDEDSVGSQPEPPRKPDPPEPPSRDLGWAKTLGLPKWDVLDPEWYSSRMPVIRPAGSPSVELVDKGGNRFTICIHIPKLNHHHTESFGEFLLMFESWEFVKPFDVVATITAANIVQKIETRIPFVIRLADSA